MSTVFVRRSTLLGMLVLCGCSFVIDADKTQCSARSDCAALFGEDTKLLCIDHFCAQPTCHSDDDCVGFGAGYEDTVCVEQSCVPPEEEDSDAGVKEPLDPAWACLDQAAPVQTLAGPFRVKMHVQHMVNQSPMAGVTARLCRKLDITCATAQSTEMSDAAGDIFLSVDANFTGYVSLTRSDLMSTSYFFNPSIRADVDLPPVQLAPAPVANALVSQVSGGPADPTRGFILLAAYNCMGSGAAGVTFSSKDGDDSTLAFYAAGGLPSKTAVETEISGFGGFVNARPGSFVIAAQRTSDQRRLGEVSVLVKAGEATITRLFPTPPPP